MTHANIYEKFLIEYDKDNVTSSYPSLTQYEIATILDKAYNALIGQKVSGNNIRRSGIETDIKSIEDLQPLMVTVDNLTLTSDSKMPSNVVGVDLPGDNLYFISANAKFDEDLTPVQLVDHKTAKRFFATKYNNPWIKNPVCFMEGNKIYVVYENYDGANAPSNLYYTYIKQPAKFCLDQSANSTVSFELNDTMAEELVSLAVTFALENVESQRLTSKLNTRGLEA